MSGVSNHILKEEYKSKIMEDLRIKTNGNSTWLYMSEYQQELTMFCCRELLNYLDENGMDAGFELKKKTVVVNASIAMIELVPWLFCEDAASVSRDEINRLMTRPDLAGHMWLIISEIYRGDPPLLVKDRPWTCSGISR